MARVCIGAFHGTVAISLALIAAQWIGHININFDVMIPGLDFTRK
jgi:hypothetical protein